MGEIFNRKELTDLRRKLRREMSKAEVMLWTQLKNKQVLGYKIRRQESIGNKIVDFYCPKINMVIEVDGATHITDEEIEKDKIRQSEIESLGIHFLRFTNPEIYYNMEEVLEKIRSKILDLTSGKGTSPQSPPS